MTGTLTSVSPQRPSDLVVEVAEASAKDVQQAVARSRQAQRGWRAMAAGERARLLEAAATELEERAPAVTALITREVGKPIGESAAEVQRAVAILRYYAQQVLDPIGDLLPAASEDGLLFSRSFPYGVAGLITPWNFPLAIPLWKAAPALAVGNSVVLKPSPEATGVALELCGILSRKLPTDLFQVAAGGTETGRALVHSADVVSFTGSAGGGSAVAQTCVARNIPVQAELGGLNATIVLEDADAETTARAVVASAVGFAGQKCTATSRVVIIGGDRRRREVEAALSAALSNTACGDPADPGVSVGPVITDRQGALIRSRVMSAVDAGAQELLSKPAVDQDGFFVAPTLLRDLPPNHELASQETFGPIFWTEAVTAVDKAIDAVNSGPYGLVTSVYTSDLNVALSALGAIETGMIRVNLPTTGVDLHAPFGGERISAIGPKEQGKAGLAFFSKTRTCTVSAAAGAGS